jgi:phosphatidylcholine synthase
MEHPAGDVECADDCTRGSTVCKREAVVVTAWLVHIYTATGALAAFLGVRAVIQGDVREAFLWMFAATVVDSTDGWFARVARVAERTPGFSGSRLDDIVDYLTFVFLPVLLMVETERLPDGAALPVAAIVLLASAYGFARDDAKTDDHFFTGFPSYWNIVALYLVALGTAPLLNALVLVTLAALVFVRTGYIYPSRTPTLRTLTVALGLAWGVMLLVVTLRLPEPPRWLVNASLFFPIYYTVLSLYLHSRRRRAPAHATQSPRPQTSSARPQAGA